jgi:hypothetical protein
VRPDRFTVTVTDRIVTTKGTPENTMAGLTIIDAARHMEGVVAIRDALGYPRTRRTSTRYPADGSGDSKEAPMMITGAICDFAGFIPVTGPRLVVLPWEDLHPWARTPHRF